MKNIDKPKLYYYLNKKNETITSLAKAMEINPVTIFRKINGDSDFYRHEISFIKNWLEIPSDEMMNIFFS